MHNYVLASDYDETLAQHGSILPSTREAIQKLKASGRKFVLVTGRELPELLTIFPDHELCDAIVAENGALLYLPTTKESRRLAEPPLPEFVSSLRRRNITPLSVGETIIATTEINRHIVLEIIKEHGLELQLIFNKGSLMILPSGVNKSSGLQEALKELRISAHNAVGIGDAENDHAFLSICHCACAVGNALPAVKERADIVFQEIAGKAVERLIDEIVEHDLTQGGLNLSRHNILLGRELLGEQSREHFFSPVKTNILVAGSSGSGKSTFTSGLLERFSETGYQFVLIDPEGDYDSFGQTIRLGDPTNAPSLDGVLDILKHPEKSVIVNLVAIPLVERPKFFAELLPRLQDLRVRYGHPHWIVVDEAHHMLPTDWQHVTSTLPQQLDGLVLITVHPEHVAPEVLQEIDIAVAVGKTPAATLAEFAAAAKISAPELSNEPLESGRVVVWFAPSPRTTQIEVVPPRFERKRHKRKYAEGDVGENSFVFEGPEKKLKLRAQNLTVFLQMAEGVDAETWLYHLRKHDYSDWIRRIIKDESLAGQIERLETDSKTDAEKSLAEVAKLIRESYTLPA